VISRPIRTPTKSRIPMTSARRGRRLSSDACREKIKINEGGFQIKALLLPAWPDLVPETTDHEPG
jgi:hypothetical protein